MTIQQQLQEVAALFAAELEDTPGLMLLPVVAGGHATHGLSISLDRELKPADLRYAAASLRGSIIASGCVQCVQIELCKTFGVEEVQVTGQRISVVVQQEYHLGLSAPYLISASVWLR